MLATPQAAELLDVAARHQWRVVLVGGPLKPRSSGAAACSPASPTPTWRSPRARPPLHKPLGTPSSLAPRAGDTEAFAA